jgi:nucleotide-binding universal stress UspA family protein
VFKSILASLTGFSSDRSVLDAAIAMAKIDNAHIQCLHIRLDTKYAAAWAGAVAPSMHDSFPEMARKLTKQQGERAVHSQAAFQDACDRHALTIADDPEKRKAISVFYQEITSLDYKTLHLARFHDLTIVARVPEFLLEDVEAVLLKSGRPVLIVPGKPTDTIGKAVAIAWKEGPEAARSVMAAAPILAQAKRVTILSVAESSDDKDAARISADHLVRNLRWHGIQADVRVETSTSVTTARTIKEMAYACEADLLVMGAYGHNRMRELVFGGVTRHLLDAAEIPIFLFH